MQRGMTVKSIPQLNTNIAFLERQKRQNEARHNAEVRFIKAQLGKPKDKVNFSDYLKFEDLPDMEFRGLEK